jgi:Transposase DDE domain
VRGAVGQALVGSVVVAVDVGADRVAGLVERLELLAPDAALLELSDATHRRQRHPGSHPARHQPQEDHAAQLGRRRYDEMREVLATERGSALYRKRQPMIEPDFAQTKFNRGPDRFRRRGRGAVRADGG